MISDELEIIFLILGLYGSTCIAFVYANEGVMRRAFRGVFVHLADERVRIGGRSLILLNPFTPMFPAFRGQWGNVDRIAASPGLPSHVPEVLMACEVLSPYVFAVFIYTIIGIPVILLLGNAALTLSTVALAYLSAVALLVRLWFLRDSFCLSGKKFALLAFESMACLPFSAGVVRRLSLMVPVGEDLISFVVDMPPESCARAAESLVDRCDAMAFFYADGCPEYARLMRYRDRLSSFVAASVTPDIEADATRSAKPTNVVHDDGVPPVQR